MALSHSITAGIGLCLGGGSTERLDEPFYTASEWARIKARREEAAERAAEMQQIIKLKRLERQWSKS